MGGPEIGHNTTFYIRHGVSAGENVPAVDEYLENMGMVGKLNTPHALNPYNKLSIFNGAPNTAYATQKGASVRIGTGFQCGMNQGDNNVPPASSRNDTYPSRPTIGAGIRSEPLPDDTTKGELGMFSVGASPSVWIDIERGIGLSPMCSPD